jgi:hypothetical protein
VTPVADTRGVRWNTTTQSETQIWEDTFTKFRRLESTPNAQPLHFQHTPYVRRMQPM